MFNEAFNKRYDQFLSLTESKNLERVRHGEAIAEEMMEAKENECWEARKENMFEEAMIILDECNALMDEEIAIRKKAVKSDSDHLRLAEICNRKSDIAASLNKIITPMENYF